MDEGRVSECSFHGFKNTSKHIFCTRRGKTILKEKDKQLVKLMTMEQILMNASKHINHTESQPHHTAILPSTHFQTDISPHHIGSQDPRVAGK